MASKLTFQYGLQINIQNLEAILECSENEEKYPFKPLRKGVSIENKDKLCVTFGSNLECDENVKNIPVLHVQII